MFARAMHGTEDMVEQHKLLTWTAQQIDAGKIESTVSKVLRPINAENLRQAHSLIESGSAKGKVVVESFT